MTYFTEDVIRVDWSFSFFLSNESREFFTSGQDCWVVQRHIDGVEDVNFGSSVGSTSLSLFLNLLDFFCCGGLGDISFLALFLPLAALRGRSGGVLVDDDTRAFLVSELGVGSVVGWDILEKLLAGLVLGVHPVVR